MKTSSMLLIAVLTTAVAPAQEWTRFRGPMGQGIGKADDLPATFTDANIRWKIDLGSKGHSSPVLWGQKLFLTRMTGEKGRRELVCLDAKSGEEQWATKCEFEPHHQHRFNSFAAATPAVDANGVHLIWTSGKNLVAVAFDHSGKRKWRRELGSFQAMHGSGSSPILFGDVMIVANDNEGETSFLTALDKASGDPRWKIARDSYPKRGAYSCPIVYTPDRGDPYLLFTSTAHGLTAVDPKAGKVLWETDLALTQRCVNTPAVSGDIVFFSGGSGGGGKESAIVRLPKDSESKPEILQRRRRSIPYVPCALALDGHFYLVTDGGVASCLEAGTGKQVWRERLEGSFFSSPVSNGKTIYIVDKEGTLFSMAAGLEFELLGTFDLGDQAFATPAIAGGLMFVRTFRKLICLGKVLAEPKKKG